MKDFSKTTENGAAESTKSAAENLMDITSKNTPSESAAKENAAAAQNTGEDRLLEQSGYSARVKSFLKENLDHCPKAFVHTYGCQQNVSDSEQLKGLLSSMGYEEASSAEDADFVLFNTCAVREHAEDRVWGNIGSLKKLKEQNPRLIIAVCGCMMQQQANADRVRRSFPYVDMVFGTFQRWRLPEFVYNRLLGSARIFMLKEDPNDIIEGAPIRRDGTFKAWVPIMYGCNNFCTYCIVPFVRGRERSREPQHILKEVKDLVADGCREITLLGQNVNSYGKNPQNPMTFAALLRKINEIPGDFRIRFMTSHPRDCTEELLSSMAECEKVCHHLHLPFQSGSSRVLKAMNRHYNREDYLKLIDLARKLMPDITLSSDIIVGFPGETYEDFLETLSLVERVRFSQLFTFIYSPRGGTPAATLPDPVSRKEKGRWFDELLKAQERISSELNRAAVGKTFEVLCEDEGRREGYIAGRTTHNTVVEFPADRSVIGQFKKVKVTALSSVLEGALLED